MLAATLADIAGLDPATLTEFDKAVAPSCRRADWLTALVDEWIALLGRQSFADLPWMPLVSGAISGLELLRDGPASCALLCVDALCLSQADNDAVVFDSGFNHFVLVAGGAMDIEHYRRVDDGSRVELTARRRMVRGDSFSTDCAVEQVRMVGAQTDTVLLRFSLQDMRARNGVIEAFDRNSGLLVRRGCADPKVSRMLALLDVAAAANPDALLPLLEQLSAHANPQLRWQAMRMWLARDALGAEPHLRTMATKDASHEVRMAATGALAVVEQALRDWRAHALAAA